MTTKVCKDINGRFLSPGMYVWYNAHLCQVSQARLDLVYLIVTVPSEDFRETIYMQRCIEKGIIGWVLAEVVRRATKADLERFEIE